MPPSGTTAGSGHDRTAGGSRLWGCSRDGLCVLLWVVEVTRRSSRDVLLPLLLLCLALYSCRCAYLSLSPSSDQLPCPLLLICR